MKSESNYEHQRKGHSNYTKYALLGFNVAIALTGIVLIAVGAEVTAAFDDYSIFLTSIFYSIPTLLIVTGVFIVIIAFFGCCGAIKENYCMIFSFSVLLGLIFILELVGGISGYVLRNDAEDLIKGKIKDSMKNYNYDHMDVLNMWDYVQVKFQCCGMYNGSDWMTEINGMPMSCCKPEPGAVNQTTCEFKNQNKLLYKDGCLKEFGDYISEQAVSLGAAGVVIAIIQFAGIFFACYIARKIKINKKNIFYLHI